MRIPSHMSSGHSFSQVPKAEIQRSTFDRSFGLKTTFDAGFLVPVLVDEVLPGDTFVVKMSALCRMATPIKPLMDNLYLDSFFFYVPTRLVWSSFVKFMGEQQSPGDSTDFTVPQMVPPETGGYNEHSLQDYMGIPTGIENPLQVAWSHNTLPCRAYYRIWNEWFRDENLQTPASLGLITTDGPDGPYVGGTGLQRRGKRHDYFTSCLPWPQKGNEAMIPVGGQAPVIANSQDAYPQFKIAGSDMSNPIYLRAGPVVSGATNDMYALGAQPIAADNSLTWHTTNLIANLSQATSVTINSLRQAFQIQKLMERDARGGTRYTELVRAHFGVISPDARLQRPEYLGGGSTPIVISPIAQTSGSAPDGQGYSETPQGNLSAIGTAAVSGHGFAKSFTEHGYIIGLVSVRADLTYQQGLERFWSRKTKYDFYWPALAHIGEQAVLNKEICLTNNGTSNDGIFGYQERYAEYRYKPSLITGKFRSSSTTSLDIWHLAQEFSNVPTLNTTFIEENPPINRVIAVSTEPQFLFDGYFNMKTARPMPVFGVPGLIDHF